MSNMDIQDTQLWAVTTVGNFLNAMRKIPAHQALQDAEISPSEFKPLYLHVAEIKIGALVKIVLKTVGQDTPGDIAIKKQVVVNTLGQYEAAAQACGEYLSLPTLKTEDDRSFYDLPLSGYGSNIYTSNAIFIKEFPQKFEELLQSNLAEIVEALGAQDNPNMGGHSLSSSVARQRANSDVPAANASKKTM